MNDTKMDRKQSSQLTELRFTKSLQLIGIISSKQQDEFQQMQGLFISEGKPKEYV